VADYAIGDVQGCYDALIRLLDIIQFNEHQDRLWFVGDLVNRGPNSLAVLRFIQALPLAPRISLGNHDLHLLSRLFSDDAPALDDHDNTLQDILNAPDRDTLGHWLRKQPILCHDEVLNIVMCHAGIAPCWTITDAKARARELEAAIAGPDYRLFFSQMYGDQPDKWSDSSIGMARLRMICNYFTRMRYCDAGSRLLLETNAPGSDAYPWYAVPTRVPISVDIVFGHWAALAGKCPLPHIHALDTGYVWGGALTAMRLQDKARFCVHAP
jgi:bis(5'-nucleosyl)-tetraphosphatase (symmetrical)